jgi:hypothetical protein
MMKTSAHDAAEPMAHPAPRLLADFGLGRLADDESGPIAEHVAACDDCRSVVATLDDDTLGMLLRAADGNRTLALVDNPGTGPGATPPSGYERLEVVGEGEMGGVYRARQVGLGRIVALKQIRPEALAGLDGVSRFRREAEAVGRLRHPNIV